MIRWDGCVAIPSIIDVEKEAAIRRIAELEAEKLEKRPCIPHFGSRDANLVLGKSLVLDGVQSSTISELLPVRPLTGHEEKLDKRTRPSKNFSKRELSTERRK